MNSPTPINSHDGARRGLRIASRWWQRPTAKGAVLYLRVSTPSQVMTDYNPEGISLPAQRDAVKAKCAQEKWPVLRDFVEPGRTATEIDRRPVFQEMIAWVRAHSDEVGYIVVYHFNRIFRNSVDAGVVKRDLARYGIRVVSTVLDLGEGPEASMVESILSAVDEYRSKADGADISYKMGAKARNGGTLGRATLGYLNKRDLSEGRNVGIVVIDPERKDHIIAAFNLYSTNEYSLEALREELTERGLRSRNGRPISEEMLRQLLINPYYAGWVTYKGELIKGRHESLISQDLVRPGPSHRCACEVAGSPASVVIITT